MSPSRSWRDVLEVEAQAPPLPCEFDECCPSQNWTYRDEDMGEPCLPFCVFFFPILMPQINHIWGNYNCFNFQKYTVQIHVSRRTSSCMKRKKGFLVKKTLAHICFLFISLPMTWDLMHRYVYILISTKRWGKKTSSEDSFCKEKQNLLWGDYYLFCFAKSKTF